jgi:hypothetical protein
MDEIAIRLLVVLVVAVLIGMSWKSEFVRPAARGIRRVVALRPRGGSHTSRAITTVRIERKGPRK